MNSSNKEKGDLYEKYIRDLLLQNINTLAWLWKDAPECELRIFGWLGDWNEFRLKRKENKINNMPDLGCDILVKNNDKYELIQCKNYAENNSVRIDDLAGFFMMMTYQLLSQNPNFLGGKVYYTSKLSRHLSSQQLFDNLQYILQNFKMEENGSTSMDVVTNLMDHPFDYQLEAYERLKNKHRTILQLPCGMGKTLISMLVGKDYDNVVIISPLKEHCLQNLERYKNETVFLEYQSLLVDSDGTRNVEEMIQFVSTHAKTILSVSYKSVDVLNQIMEHLKNCIVIVDEFHNISYNDVIDLDALKSSDEMESENEDETETSVQTPINKLLYNENVRILFMSATPRLFDFEDDSLNSNIFGNIDYSFEMGEAIRKQYICDYEIYIPHVSLSKSNSITNEIQNEIQQINVNNLGLLPKIHFIVRGCLENGSKKCICYFNTQEEAKTFKETLLQCNEYYYLDLFVDTILSEDTHKNRRNKLDSFKQWEGLAFLCSVRILDECIDIPSCDSIFMTTTCDSKIKNIQRLSRANRKDSNNIHKISRIYIWTEEHNDMVNMISHLKEYDNNFTHQKVKIINTEKNTTKPIVLNRDTDEKAEYKDLDNLIIGIKKILTWGEKLEKVRQYVEEHGHLPSCYDKNNDIKSLGYWISDQKQNYRINNMKNGERYKKWSEFVNKYIDLLKSNEQIWDETLEKIKQYISDNGCLPSLYDTNKHIKSLGRWIHNQKNKYITKKQIMKQFEYYNKWSMFINEYADLFKSNEQIWNETLEKVKKYIIKYNKLPSYSNRNEEIKALGSWISQQKKNFDNEANIMKNEQIYNKWCEFINEYAILFKSNAEIWFENLEQVKQYIVENGILPSSRSKNKDIKSLGEWIFTQKQKYKNKTNIMQNEEIYNTWCEFVKNYVELFKTNDELWYDNLENIKQYITANGKLPSENNSLGKWITHQKANYKNKANIMKNEEIYNKFSKFINDYAEFFKSNEETWHENLEKVKQYIAEHNKLPSSTNKNKNIKALGNWISIQKQNYKNKVNIMKQIEYQNIWLDFSNECAILITKQRSSTSPTNQINAPSSI